MFSPAPSFLCLLLSLLIEETRAIVLWLGNITFLKKKYDDSVEINAPEALQTACKLLQCTEEELKNALTTRIVVMKNERYPLVFSFFLFLI